MADSDSASETVDRGDMVDHCPHCGAVMDVSEFAPLTEVVCPECSQEIQLMRDFGGYKLRRRVGIGGMSLVFGGVDEHLGREVAIKVLNDRYALDEKRVAQFEHEGHITASISHPHVVRVMKVGRDFGRYFIAMEMVNGGSLEELMERDETGGEERLVEVMREVTEGLQAGYQAGLLHRDIKPGNIMFDQHGKSKIVDFGLALVTQDGSAQAEEIWATPYYVPPESLEGKPEDFRADMYALGATMYHALSGVEPFTEETKSLTRLGELKREIPALAEVAPHLGGAICRVVDKAMAFDPKDRFVNYEAMLQAIGEVQNGVNAEDLSFVAVNREKTSGGGWVRGVGMAAAVLVACCLGWLLWGGDEDVAPNESPAGAMDGTEVLASGGDEIGEEERMRWVVIQFSAARASMKEGHFEAAAERYAQVAAHEEVSPEASAWAVLQEMNCWWLARDEERAESTHRMARSEESAQSLDGLRAGLSGVLSGDLPTVDRVDAWWYSAVFAQGMRAWNLSRWQDAVQAFALLESIDHSGMEPEVSYWAAHVRQCLHDEKLLRPWRDDLEANSEDGYLEMVRQLEEVIAILKTRGRALRNVQWMIQHCKVNAQRLAREAEIEGEDALGS